MGYSDIADCINNQDKNFNILIERLEQDFENTEVPNFENKEENLIKIRLDESDPNDTNDQNKPNNLQAKNVNRNQIKHYSNINAFAYFCGF